MTEMEARILYTNWRGETAWRRIMPARIWFGSTTWHPQAQWLLTAKDVDRGEDRDFAMSGIKEWKDDEGPWGDLKKEET